MRWPELSPPSRPLACFPLALAALLAFGGCGSGQENPPAGGAAQRQFVADQNQGAAGSKGPKASPSRAPRPAMKSIKSRLPTREP